MSDWTFFSNHGHVLVCLARNNKARLRDVAMDVGITERAVQKIVRDLRDAEIIEVSKQGRCNRYRINRRKSLRHGLESHCTVGKLLNLVGGRTPAPSRRLKDAGADLVTEPDAAVKAEKTESAEAKASPPDKQESQPVSQQEAAKPVKNEPAARPATKSSKSRPVDTRQQGSLF